MNEPPKCAKCQSPMELGVVRLVKPPAARLMPQRTPPSEQPVTSFDLCRHLCRWPLFGLLLSSFLSAWAAPVDSVRVILPPQAKPSIQNTARILERQLAQRCGTKVTLTGESTLSLELSIEPGLGAVGFRIIDGYGWQKRCREGNLRHRFRRSILYAWESWTLARGHWRQTAACLTRTKDRSRTRC
jgi:hypothetical protein